MINNFMCLCANIKRGMVKRKYFLLSFILVLMVLLFFAFTHEEMPYFGDSASYNNYSNQFVTDGSFSFLNIGISFRGYALPFIIFISRCISQLLFISEQTLYLIINCLMITTLISAIVPNLLKAKYNKKLVFGSVLFAFIFSYYWPDFLYFPLSDMWALFFFACGILLIIKVEEMSNDKLFKTKLFYIYTFLIGFTFYFAYNIRTVYEMAIILTLLIFVFRCIRRKKLKKSVIIFSMLAIFSGYLFSGIPQYIINSNITPQATIKVQAIYGEESLILFQLYWGILYPRYETNVESYKSDVISYPEPGVKFIDKNAELLFAEVGKNMTLSSLIGSYLKHPFEYTKIYLRHAVNGLNPIFRESYITDMQRNKLFAFNINYIILFIALIAFIKHFKELLHDRFYLFFFAFVSFIAVPGAVEVRFFLPMFIIIYGLVCYKIRISHFTHIIRSRKTRYFALTMFVILYLYNYRVVDSTLKSTERNISIHLNGGK